jgi:hypothetical protein
MRDMSVANWLAWGGKAERYNFYLVCPWCGSANLKILDSESGDPTRGGLIRWNYVRACLDCKSVTETTAFMQKIGDVE